MHTNATTNEANNNVTSLPSPQKPQTSKDLIAANVKLLIEQLEAGHSEGLTAYLTAMGRFHNYSFGNILEIARQKPEATRVAGLYAWNQLGRKVTKARRASASSLPWSASAAKRTPKPRRTSPSRISPFWLGSAQCTSSMSPKPRVPSFFDRSPSPSV